MASDLSQFRGINLRRGTQFLSPHLRVGIRIYPVNDVHPYAPPRGSMARVLDWSGATDASIIGFNWTKSMGGAGGSWTATVKQLPDGRNVMQEQHIRDGDWADVAILRNGVRIPLCRGVVRGVRESRSSTGGATSQSFTITGVDHGFFFEQALTWNSLWSRTLQELVQGIFTNRVKGEVGGSPDVMFRALIEGYFSGGTVAGVPSGQWQIPESLQLSLGGSQKRLFDVLKVLAFNAEPSGPAGLRGTYANEIQLWTVGEQTLHQTLSQWCNPLLNEWFYDLLPGPGFMPANGLAKFLSADKGLFASGGSISNDGQAFRDSSGGEFGTMAAIIRERPFPTEALGKDSLWYSLPTWRVPRWLCETDDLGFGSEERFNLFELIAAYGMGPQQEQAAYGKPVWWESDIAQRGLRVWSQTSIFLAEAQAASGQWAELRRNWLHIVRDWFAANPYLRQGTITLKTLLPEIRIGHRLILEGPAEGEAEQFYVEGVRLDYRAPSAGSGAQGSTTLIVTRGFVGTDDDLRDKVNATAALFKEQF